MPPLAGGAEGKPRHRARLTTSDQYEDVLIIDALRFKDTRMGGDNKAAYAGVTLLFSWGHEFEGVRTLVMPETCEVMSRDM
jgi:hypothetical protein